MPPTYYRGCWHVVSRGFLLGYRLLLVSKDRSLRSENLLPPRGVAGLTSRLQSGDASTADINAAIKFLKDNGIDCAGSANPDVQDLVANLPTFEDVSKDEVSLLN